MQVHVLACVFVLLCAQARVGACVRVCVRLCSGMPDLVLRMSVISDMSMPQNLKMRL